MAKYVKFTGQYKQVDLTEGRPYKLVYGCLITNDVGEEIMIMSPENNIPCAHLNSRGYWEYCDYKGNSYDSYLIACAPEMYEMLKSLREDYGLLTDIGKDIDKLLAKARGEL